MFQAGSFPVAKRLVNLGYKVICSTYPAALSHNLHLDRDDLCLLSG